MFSGAPKDLTALIGKQSEGLRTLLSEREKYAKRLAEFEAKELWNSAPEAAGRKVIQRIFGAGGGDTAKALAHAVAKLPSAVALLGVAGNPAMLVYAQTPGAAADMGEILRETVARDGGKGGGARNYAQGRGLDESRLDEALEFAVALL